LRSQQHQQSRKPKTAGSGNAGASRAPAKKAPAKRGSPPKRSFNK